MPLRHYDAKRDFSRTPEPPGRLGRGQHWRFVVQQHAARRMHWDLRLEFEGVLKSWAVPKGPSLHPSTQRLAVQTEDHPVSYANFEGVIPAGAYGGGSMIVWDTGTWRPTADAARGLAKGHLTFELTGHKLRGAWHLVRTGDTKSKQWLLRKADDAHSRLEGDIVGDLPRSVLTQRLVTDLGPEGTDKGPIGAALRQAAATTLDPLPRAIAPQLATLVAEPPPGAPWLYEVKLDGYRLLASRLGDDVRLTTRNGFDWTDRLPSLVVAVRALPLQRFVLDGELVVLDDHGRSSFKGLQDALAGAQHHLLLLCAFDLLIAGDADLRGQSQLARKKALKQLLMATQSNQPAVVYWPHIKGAAAGRRALLAASQGGLEGLIAKRADAPYRMGRSRDWLKLKCMQQMACVVGGCSSSGGSLLVGAYDDGGALRYLGKVGTGMTKVLRAQLRPLMATSAAKASPFLDGPPASDVVWLEPRLVVQVRYLQRTAQGRLRHSSLLGLRPDKPAQEVQAPQILCRPDLRPRQKRASLAAAASDKAAASARAVGNVSITHPRRRLVPGSVVTKQGLADYICNIAPWMLQHLAQRPLSVLRCPDSKLQRSFFHKHLTKQFAGLGEMVIDGKKYAYALEARGLLELVQLSVLEWHTWGCLAPKVEAVDTIVFDLDPGEGVGSAQIISAAHRVRQVLRQLGLTSLLKATGGKGLHVVVPGVKACGWPEAKAFGQLVADYVVAQDRNYYTAVMAKVSRRGKVFIDYFRNGRGNTSVAAYSPRARPGLPIARPLAWQALDAQAIETPWDIPRMMAELARGYGDPWRRHRRIEQSISPQIRAEAMKHAAGGRN